MNWTDDDIKRAAKEGWKLQNGFVSQAYDTSGWCPFLTVSDVIKFLRSKGKKSEWHKEVYLSLPWTFADDRMLLAEGWQMGLQSIFPAKSAVFAPNVASRESIVAKAQAGDPLYIKALSTLAKRRLIYGDQ